MKKFNISNLLLFGALIISNLLLTSSIQSMALFEDGHLPPYMPDTITWVSKDNHEFTVSRELAQQVSPVLLNSFTNLLDGDSVASNIPKKYLIALLTSMRILTTLKKNIACKYVFIDLIQKVAPLLTHFNALEILYLLERSYMLQIEPLVDILSYMLALYRHKKKTTDPLFFQRIEAYLINLPGTIYQYILKHAELIEVGLFKFSLADYITLINPIINNGVLSIENKGITSLEGIEHINNPHLITTLNLSCNFILDPSIDTYKNYQPFKQFVNLTHLYLHNTQLKATEPSFFYGQRNLQIKVLNNNPAL